MNTKKNQTKIYLALSLLALAMIALAGCSPMEVSAAQIDTTDIAATEVSAESTSLPDITPIQSDDDAIRAALAAHFGIDESEFTHFEIVENTGLHARGGVAANDGGGYFLVAKVDGQWVFVDGGQAAPNCNDVASYGFSASMVPECSPPGSSTPGCLVATFIQDVTYPDGSIVSPGQRFTKTWRIKNVGTCTWDAGYQIVFDNGAAMGGPASQQLTGVPIPPGKTMDISIDLVAPATPGTFTGYWKLRAASGDTFGLTNGNPIWVEVKVLSASSDERAIRAALAAHFGIDESEFTRFEIGENTGTHAKGNVAANDGGGYFLVAKVNGQWVFVAGGQAAPDCALVAQYGFPASMVPWCPTGGSNAPDCPGLGVLMATFIQDVTYPDGSELLPGQSFTKTWRIKNVGTCTWNSEYQLVFDSGDAMNGPAYQQLTDVHVPPGQTLDISVELTAQVTPGTYRSNWKLRVPNGDIFGLTNGNPIWVEIEVDDEDSQSSYTGYPSIRIADVTEDQSVTIKGLNFPLNDTFIVLLNYNGTNGIDGEIVSTIKTDESGEFSATYTIPTFLHGQDKIAIRLESPSSGYYAYNWFYN